MKNLTLAPAWVERKGVIGANYVFTVWLKRADVKTDVNPDEQPRDKFYAKFVLSFPFDRSGEAIVRFGEVETNDCQVGVSADGIPTRLYALKRGGAEYDVDCNSAVEEEVPSVW